MGPSYGEAEATLLGYVRPAATASLEPLDALPEELISRDYCQPLTSGAVRPRPTVSYSFTIASTETDGFLSRVVGAWTEMGLSVEERTSGSREMRVAGKDGYSLRAFVDTQTLRAYIGGSGPCVDNPDAE